MARNGGLVFCLFLLLLASATVIGSEQPESRQATERGSSIGSYNRIISPVAVITVITSGRSRADRVLELLVLWRGSPGWFFKGGGSGMSGGGSGRTYSETIRFGELAMYLKFDFSTRIVSIDDGKPIAMKDANVLLVDGVDSPAGMSGFHTLRVASVIDDATRIEPVLKSSAQILEFLRCDVRLDDPGRDAAVQRICAAIIGK